ncbi:uncharacterized protein [Nothobranchius furzeri]|uniref:uncharacterized protein n=1 Tax=Nothobranchius furzeri TaxID=105023 RepID=UPI003904B2AA
MGETSISRISDVHRASVAPTAEILLGSGEPPDPGGADAGGDAPPMTPHPVAGRVEGGTETPAEAQYSEVGSSPTEKGADALTDLTPLQQATMTSKLQVGETPTKRRVRCRPVNLLVDPDLSERIRVSTGDLPGSTSAPDPRKPAPVYSLKHSWFQSSGQMMLLVLVTCLCLFSQQHSLIRPCGSGFPLGVTSRGLPDILMSIHHLWFQPVQSGGAVTFTSERALQSFINIPVCSFCPAQQTGRKIPAGGSRTPHDLRASHPDLQSTSWSRNSHLW